MKLSNNPPKWTADRTPEEFRVRKYIFDTWRSVCTSFGYQEYLGPLVEDIALWEAKSWDDVWGTELTQLTDREGNVSSLAIRPEMTPTVTRMITKYRRDYQKPIRRFSIANFYRNEKPQRWRNREFWQLNIDVFWSSSLYADMEIIQLGIEIMKSFGAEPSMYQVYVNHRGLIDAFLKYVSWSNQVDIVQTIRIMDKRKKLSNDQFKQQLWDLWATPNQISMIWAFMKCDSLDDLTQMFPILTSHPSVQELDHVISWLHTLGYNNEVKFSSSLMRWFDYYDWVVFEFFDMHSDNNRALFGWWRYNGLAKIFGVRDDIPAVGCAPWDEPLKLFLESRNLLPKKNLQTQYWYVPLLDEWTHVDTSTIVHKLRSSWKIVETWLDLINPNKMWKLYQSCESRWVTHVLMSGSSWRTVKDLNTWNTYPFDQDNDLPPTI